MKSSFYKLLTLAGLVFLSNTAFAQQETMYTQYMFNLLSINPAYAGSHDALSLSALHRTQWAGIEGAPVTQTFSLHSPIGTKKTSLGMNLTNDKIGVSNSLTMNFAYAYRFPVANGHFSLGLQAGFTNFALNYNDLKLEDANDPALAGQTMSSFAPNVGAGLFYHTNKFYIGASAPKILNNEISTENGDYTYVEKNHYFVHTGYVFTVSPTVKLKPNLLFKGVEGAPLTLDVNLNMLLQDFLWVGVSYRSLESVDFLVEFQLTENLRLGYAYDMITSNLGQVTTGSHELMLNYRFTPRKDKIITPRYF